MRRILSSFGRDCGRIARKLYWPPTSPVDAFTIAFGSSRRPSASGNGKRLSIAAPARLNWLAGILLPGNGVCVVGSKIGIRTPCVVAVLEKSPARSSALGIVNVLLIVFLFRR